MACALQWGVHYAGQEPVPNQETLKARQLLSRSTSHLNQHSSYKRLYYPLDATPAPTAPNGGNYQLIQALHSPPLPIHNYENHPPLVVAHQLAKHQQQNVNVGGGGGLYCKRINAWQQPKRFGVVSQAVLALPA